MTTNMFIPKKLRVGFCTRTGTFSGKLAYVIYYDEKGNLRKEASWKTWCDKDTEVLELDNIPQPNFILNKGVKRDGYWGNGHSKIRVHDPRDFEIEISVDNLMGILMHSDVSKRDIEVECVYAWSGTELVLLPINSVEYQDSVAYTAKQDQKITAKDFVAGYTYQAKKSDDNFIYIGHFEWFEWNHGYKHEGKLYSNPRSGSYSNHNYFSIHESKGKKHIFYNDNLKCFVHKTAADFSSIVANFVSDNYSQLVDTFFTTENSQKIIKIVVNNVPKKKSYYNEQSLYFIEDDNLILSNLSYRNTYHAHNTQEHCMEYSLDFTGHLIDLSKGFSKRAQTNISTNFTKSLQKEFTTKFGQPVLLDKHQQLEQSVKEWLIEKGFGINYSYVLENEKEIVIH